jgi:hypothetical protein
MGAEEEFALTQFKHKVTVQSTAGNVHGLNRKERGSPSSQPLSRKEQYKYRESMN